jgi:broad specificity phosphatase PhoE
MPTASGFRFAVLLALLPLLMACAPARAATAPGQVWDMLRAGGVVVLLRHAGTVSGIGDPAGFQLDDCATQRNLSDAGRQQARRLGEAFRAAGVPVGDVLSSRWCRCLDTATEAFGRVTPWPTVDSFFDPRLTGTGADAGAQQTAALRKRIAGFRGKETLVVITHQVNITALTGVYPAMGEAVIVRPAPRTGAAGLEVAGRLLVP